MWDHRQEELLWGQLQKYLNVGEAEADRRGEEA